MIDVGAAIDEQGCDIVVPVVDREPQYVFSVGRNRIDVRAARDQCAGRVQLAFARSEMQRRETAVRVARRENLRIEIDWRSPFDTARALGTRGNDFRCHVDVGTLRDEQPDHLGVVLRNRPHQRRRATP